MPLPPSLSFFLLSSVHCPVRGYPGSRFSIHTHVLPLLEGTSKKNKKQAGAAPGFSSNLIGFSWGWVWLGLGLVGSLEKFGSQKNVGPEKIRVLKKN